MRHALASAVEQVEKLPTRGRQVVTLIARMLDMADPT